MPQINRNQTFEGGVLQREDMVTIDDATLHRWQAPDRIRQAVSTLNAWGADEQQTAANWPGLTAAQKDAANRQLHDRVGRFFDRFGDLLIALALDGG
jgi:hypothetical protein